MTEHDQPAVPAPMSYAAVPGAAPAAYAAGQPTNAMAIIALVASILGWIMFPLVGSVVGIILGHQARKQMARSGESGAGMATAAIVLGWIMIALLAVTLIVVLAFLVVAVVASSPQ